MSRRLAILRPEPGNTLTAARAAALGLDTVRLPLFEIVSIGWSAPDPAAFDALVLTSANAVRMAGPGLDRLRALPVHAVGAATAQAAAAAGLAVVATGEKGAAALLAGLAADGVRAGLHLGGRDRRIEPGGPIAAAITVYASDPSAVAAAELARLRGTTALLHSPRAAARLAALVDDARIPRATIGLAALSDAVATAAGSGWARLGVADVPDDASLLACALAD